MIDKDDLSGSSHFDRPHTEGDECEDDQDDLAHSGRAQHLRLVLPGEPVGLWQQSLLHFLWSKSVPDT